MANEKIEMTNQQPGEISDNWFYETLKSLVIAVVLALVFRSFAFEPFYIPSGSMKSSLLVGDYVFVSKHSYGYSRYSFPFGLPLFEGRVLKDTPKRGDVIVFKLPSNTNINYIKRLIGMPGDRIRMLGGVLYLNGKAVPKKRIDNFTDKDSDGNFNEIPRYVETLPNGVSYHVLDEDKNGAADNTVEYTVPEGHYFFMGDNRDNSQDSRFLGAVGFVPEENLLGPANFIFYSTGAKLINPISWFTELRYNRLFSTITHEPTDE